METAIPQTVRSHNKKRSTHVNTTNTSVAEREMISTRQSRGTDPPRFGRVDSSCPITSAAQRQRDQLPDFAPLMEEIEIAGWSSHRRQLSANFHDWLLLGDGRMLVTVGQSFGGSTPDSIEGALVAQAAWSAVRAHALHTRDAGILLSLAARSLWPIPGAAANASVAVALVDSIGGRASVALAGDCLLWRVRAATFDQLLDHQPALGVVSDFSYRTHEVELSLRERLLLVADNPEQRTAKMLAALASGFSQLDAETHRRMTANDTLSFARGHFERASGAEACATTSIAAIRRR